MFLYSIVFSLCIYISYISYYHVSFSTISNTHTQDTIVWTTFEYNSTTETTLNTAFIHSNSLIRLIIVSPYYLYTLSRFSQLVTTINLIRTDPTKSKSKKKKQKKIQNEWKNKIPNWNQIEQKQKSNKLRSNQAVFTVGVSRYLIAVDSWLRSRHHHRYLCRRPLSSAAHHCHHHCTYLSLSLSAYIYIKCSRSLSPPLSFAFVVHFIFVFQHYSYSLTYDHRSQHSMYM